MFVGLMYLAFMILIVTGRSDTATSRCAFLPRSQGDALALAFHTLELIVANGVLVCWFGVSLLHGDASFTWILLTTGISSIILVVMSFASWKHDRSLSKTGMLFGVPVAALFLLMMTRQ